MPGPHRPLSCSPFIPAWSVPVPARPRPCPHPCPQLCSSWNHGLRERGCPITSHLRSCLCVLGEPQELCGTMGWLGVTTPGSSHSLPSLRLHAVQPRRLAWPPHSPAARERILPPQPHLRPFHNEGSGGPAQAASGGSGAGGGAHSKGLSVKYCSAPRNPSNPVSRPEADAGYSPGWRWPDFALHVAEKGFEAVWDAVPPPHRRPSPAVSQGQ